jgi:hypothetical protein
MQIPVSLPPRKPSAAPSLIPRMLYQTFKSRDVPAGMAKAVNSWIEKNPEFGYRFFDDAAMRDFVERYPCEGFAFDSSVLLRALDTIRPGAGKADLFRYLLIYDRGGVYMDVDSFCLNPLGHFVSADDDVVTGLGGRGDFHQWGLIYSPRHPFLKRTIENAVSNILNRSFAPGFANSLEGIAGPPCLDLSIKQVLNLPLKGRFTPGVYTPSIGGRSYKINILPTDFFGGHVGFKYPGYKNDLSAMGVRYWMDDTLFND